MKDQAIAIDAFIDALGTALEDVRRSLATTLLTMPDCDPDAVDELLVLAQREHEAAIDLCRRTFHRRR